MADASPSTWAGRRTSHSRVMPFQKKAFGTEDGCALT